MTTIRKMCLNDVLHMNDLLMGESIGTSLYYNIAQHPEYALVAVSPSNRILGFITRCVQARGTETVCPINGIFGDAGDMLILAVIKKAEELGVVEELAADVPSNDQGLLDFFEKHGFIWDGEQPEGSTKTLWKKLSQNGEV